MVETAINSSVIVGLGGTGLSCARYFTAIGRSFKVVDTRNSPPGLAELRVIAPSCEIELGPLNEATLCSASEIVISPGVSLATPEISSAQSAGVKITGDIDIFSKVVKKPVIAVTGSNGKSTVVALLADILKKAGIEFGLGGNLDGENFRPALDLLLEPEKEFYVLELSSFQLETTEKLSAEVATLLNLSEDHMDRYVDLDSYHRAKQRIFRGCKNVLINNQDYRSQPASELGVPVLEFGLGVPSKTCLGIIQEKTASYLAIGSEKIVAVSDLKVVGSHNILNVLAATGLALTIGVEMGPIRKAILAFRGLPHRCQWVASIRGVEFYNDSKGTNVAASVSAIEGLGERISGRVLLIAGGIAKGADLQAIAPAIRRWGNEVILIGQDANVFAKSLDQETVVHFATNIEEAVSLAFSCAQDGDAVLLSPACASFDMFENFQHRGNAFIAAVGGLH